MHCTTLPADSKWYTYDAVHTSVPSRSGMWAGTAEGPKTYLAICSSMSSRLYLFETSISTLCTIFPHLHRTQQDRAWYNYLWFALMLIGLTPLSLTAKQQLQCCISDFKCSPQHPVQVSGCHGVIRGWEMNISDNIKSTGIFESLASHQTIFLRYYRKTCHRL